PGRQARQRPGRRDLIGSQPIGHSGPDPRCRRRNRCAGDHRPARRRPVTAATAVRAGGPDPAGTAGGSGGVFAQPVRRNGPVPAERRLRRSRDACGRGSPPGRGRWRPLRAGQPDHAGMVHPGPVASRIRLSPPARGVAKHRQGTGARYDLRAAMLALVALHFVTAAVSPALVRWLGPRAFLILAAVPAGSFGWLATLAPQVTGPDAGTVTQSYQWIELLDL